MKAVVAAAGTAVWWTVLAVDIGQKFPLERSDLVPPPTAPTRRAPATPVHVGKAAARDDDGADDDALVAWRLGDAACVDGGDASKCVVALSSEAPLEIHTGLPRTPGCKGRESDPTGCFAEHMHETWSIGPVCTAGDDATATSARLSSSSITGGIAGGSSARSGGVGGGVGGGDGVALLGELHKYVAVSPDRLSSVSCSSSSSSDKAAAATTQEDAGASALQLDVSLHGAAGESVELLFLRRCGGESSLRAVTATIDAKGEGRVVCGACGASRGCE